MGKEATCWALAALCGLACLCCPCAIVWLGETYGFDRLPSDEDFRTWPLYAVDGLFWIDLCFTIGLIWSMRSWRWLGALVAVPLLVVTAVLAITCGMWIEGTYF
jgi:hypothetical protein